MFTKSTVSQSMIDAVNSILDEDKKTKAQQLDEASAFDWKANKNETDPKFTTKKPGERTGHESKKTTTGTVYTKKPLRSDGQEFKKEETEISFKDRLLALKTAQRHIQTESKTFDELLEDLNEEQVDKLIFEVLGKDADAGDYIHDFIHSKNSKFAGKSKEMRKKMALGAYYGKHNEEVKDEYARKVDKYLKKKYNKEEVEELDEAKKNPGYPWNDPETAKSVKKIRKMTLSSHAKNVNGSKLLSKARKQLRKGDHAGISDTHKAFERSRISAEWYRHESVEHIDELSKGTLNSYMDKAKDRYIKHASSTSTSDHVANVKSVKYAKNMLKAKEKGGKFSEEAEKESHQSATTMKHIPNPSPALKKAAKDIKPGIAGYRDRIAMLKAGGVKEEAELDEANKESKKDFQDRQQRLATAGAETAKDPARLKRLSNIPGYSAAMNLAKKTTKEEVEGVDEALIGGQKKIDKNHNGKIDGQDFKILRGQKTEAVEPTAVTTDTLAGPVKGGKPNQHSSIKVKLKAESVEKDKPPFDGPYTKSKGNIKDKSGAIHTPMSRARDLAKNAMKKVKTEMLGKTGTSE